MSESDSKAALVHVQSSALACRASVALAKRGLSDLESLESGEVWFQKAKELYSAALKKYSGASGAQFRSSFGEFFRCLQRAAKCDPQHSGIQCWLATAYRDGLGTEEDLVEAAKWFRRAADQGVPEAQYELANMFDFGRGVPQDSSEAVRLYRMASEQGHIDAQLALGVAYADGSGLSKNLAESARWFRRAAENGSDIGQYLLAEAIAEGKGVPRDYTEAAAWYRKAAEQGFTLAPYKLGLMYKKGDGVEKDLGEAAKWFRRAADLGVPEAHYELGYMLLHGSWFEKDYAQAFRYLRKAAEPRDNLDRTALGTTWLAQIELAMMYKKGYGVAIDAQQSNFWFRKSVATHEQLSKLKLQSLPATSES